MGDQRDKFHMNLPKEQVEAVKQERLRREEQQRIEIEIIAICKIIIMYINPPSDQGAQQ